MNLLGNLAGIRVITNDSIGDPYEDWSGVRSPGRARRRRAKGHPQRIVVRYRSNGQFYHDRLHNAIVCHPADYVRIQQTVAVRAQVQS